MNETVNSLKGAVQAYLSDLLANGYIVYDTYGELYSTLSLAIDKAYKMGHEDIKHDEEGSNHDE